MRNVHVYVFNADLLHFSFSITNGILGGIVKLDYQTVRVDLGGALPSQKRMKKRRELDALIGNRSKKEVHGADGKIEYDSLHSSLSSPTPDTYMPANYYTAARRINRTSGNGCGCTFRRLIRICLPVCFLSLVAACITACIAIVWLQVNLKTDVDKLKEHVTKLETWQAEQPAAVDQMSQSVAKMEEDIKLIDIGENGIKSLAKRLALLTEKFDEQVGVPSQKLDQLKSDSAAVRTKLEELESAVKELRSQSAAIKTSQGLLTASNTKLQSAVDEIKGEMSKAEVKQREDILSSRQMVKVEISKLNETVLRASHDLTVLDQKIEDVKKSTSEKLHQVQQNLDNIKQTINTKELDSSDAPSTLASNAHREPKKADSSEHNEANSSPNPTSSHTAAIKPTVSLYDAVAYAKSNFESLDLNKNLSLSQDELAAHFGEQASEILLKFDSNDNGSLSKSELESAGSQAKQKRDIGIIESMQR